MHSDSPFDSTPGILLQCIVVIYQCPLEDSRTLQSLRSLPHKQPLLLRRIGILVFDNSPAKAERIAELQNFGAFEYCHNPRNGGLASAYNEALDRAQKTSAEWLLLLDQDTDVSYDFISTLFVELSTGPLPHVSAIVPKLVQNGKLLSPQRVGRFRNEAVPLTACGLQTRPVTAFNSASCLRVSALRAVNGFPFEYWLDFLDHTMFFRLQENGGKVFLLDVLLNHQHSLENVETEMSLDRHANLLSAEWRFIQETGQGGGIAVHRLRLLKRFIKELTRLRDKEYALQTLKKALDVR